jgi:hypothetical protein
MTELALFDLDAAHRLFEAAEPRPLQRIALLDGGRPALVAANLELGWPCPTTRSIIWPRISPRWVAIRPMSS